MKLMVEEKHIDPRFPGLFKETFGFTNDEFSLFLSCFSYQYLRKKEYYFRAGQICNTKAYINKGCSRTFVLDEQGHERILFFAFEDWWIGDFDSYYTGKPGTNSVQALEDCELLVISKEKFSALEQEIPKLKQWYTYKVTRATSASLKRMEEMKTLTPEERYQTLLSEDPQVIQRIPLQYIAAYLNIEAQSLSRLRKRLASKR